MQVTIDSFNLPLSDVTDFQLRSDGTGVFTFLDGKRKSITLTSEEFKSLVLLIKDTYNADTSNANRQAVPRS